MIVYAFNVNSLCLFKVWDLAEHFCDNRNSGVQVYGESVYLRREKELTYQQMRMFDYLTECISVSSFRDSMSEPCPEVYYTRYENASHYKNRTRD